MAEKEQTPDPKAAAAPAKDAKPRKVPELQADRVTLSEHRHQNWFAHIPHGTEVANLEEPSYWAHMSHQLKQLDLIECIWEDNSREATLRVLGSGHGWVKVSVLSSKEYPRFSPEKLNTILPGHKVQYVNNFVKWVVLREADNRRLKEGCDTEAEAFTWLANYAKSLAA